MKRKMSHSTSMYRTLVPALVAGLAATGIATTAQGAASSKLPNADVGSSASAAAVPRYVVEFTHFKCVDESGIDWIGSDEPYWVTTAKRGSMRVNTTTSEVFGDVDSGETRRFSVKNRRNVVWPFRGSIQGSAGPIAFSTQLWEDDAGGSVAEVLNKTWKVLDVVDQLGKPIGVDKWAPRVPPIVRSSLYKFFADDMMGSRTFYFDAAQLARRLKTVGSTWVPAQKYRFSGRSGDIPVIDVAGGPDYDLTLRIIRVA